MNPHVRKHPATQTIRWGMVIDLRKCIGCGVCAVVCSQSHQVPANLWRRVFECGVSAPPERTRLCFPMSCMHCNEPPCQEVCPTTATRKRSDGIVDIDYELCIGCGYCVVACPYYARTLMFNNEYDLVAGPAAEPSASPGAHPNRIGVCSKCDFCLPRVAAGEAKGLRPGVDADATPLCVVSCTSKALYFGNLNDPDSEVSRMIRENKAVCLQEELGTDPSVFYIEPN